MVLARDRAMFKCSKRRKTEVFLQTLENLTADFAKAALAMTAEFGFSLNGTFYSGII